MLHRQLARVSNIFCTYNPPGNCRHFCLNKSDWRKIIDTGYIWHDFSCIPQPLAHKKKMDAAAGCDRPAAAISSMASMASMLNESGSSSSVAPRHAGGLAPRHAGMLNADHRKGGENDGDVMKRLTAQLTAAVDSIPAYVERCQSMWVLVPPIQHHDVDGAVCSFASWRTRGWCRMEFAAAHLATHEMPVLVVESENSPPEYFNPCEVVS